MEATLIPLQTEQASHVKSDFHPSVLADIYQENCNLAAWHRTLSYELNGDIKELISNKALFNYRTVIKPDEISEWLTNQWSDINCPHLIADIQNLVTMYADLFDVDKIGLRLELVNKTVCPYFHVDKVVSRLVTTYHGPATEWLREDNTNHEALEQRRYADIVRDEKQLRQAMVGDVMVFKGESWQNSRVEPIVHRSPQCPSHQRRLLRGIPAWLSEIPPLRLFQIHLRILKEVPLPLPI